MDAGQPPAVIASAINAVMGEVTYVQKRGENKFHNYKFAAMGDLLAKVQPSMAKHGLIVIQNERKHALSPNGGIMEVEYEFTLAHKSGAVWPDRPVHTGMAAAANSKGGFDDKCVNKCMTAARKYFLLALFQIPTGDADDPDAHEDTESEPQRQQQARRDPSPPIPPSQPPAAKNGNGSKVEFVLMAPNGKVAERFGRPGEFLEALDQQMADGDDPQAWWEPNKTLAMSISEKWPAASRALIEHMLQRVEDYGRMAQA